MISKAPLRARRLLPVDRFSAVIQQVRRLATPQLLDATAPVAYLVAVLAELAGGTAWSTYAVLPLIAWRLSRFTACVGSALLAIFFAPDASGFFTLYGAAYLAHRHLDPREQWVAGAAVITWFVLMTSGLPGEFGYGQRPLAPALLGILVGVVAAELAHTTVRSQLLRDEATELRETGRVREERAVWHDQRSQLARELHDVVGHHVTAMVVQAEAGLAGRPDQTGPSFRTIASLGRAALGDLDVMVHALRDPGGTGLEYSSAPRIADLPLLVEPLLASGVDVQVHIADNLEPEEAVQLTVYRIVQESLTNVLRHAQAQHAWVDVDHDGSHVHVRVSDDGVGPPTGSTHGSGLVGIAERVNAHRGVWTCSTRPGGGTSIDAFLPAGTPP